MTPRSCLCYIVAYAWKWPSHLLISTRKAFLSFYGPQETMRKPEPMFLTQLCRGPRPVNRGYEGHQYKKNGGLPQQRPFAHGVYFLFCDGLQTMKGNRMKGWISITDMDKNTALTIIPLMFSTLPVFILLSAALYIL